MKGHRGHREQKKQPRRNEQQGAASTGKRRIPGYVARVDQTMMQIEADRAAAGRRPQLR